MSQAKKKTQGGVVIYRRSLVQKRMLRIIFLILVTFSLFAITIAAFPNKVGQRKVIKINLRGKAKLKSDVS